MVNSNEIGFSENLWFNLCLSVGNLKAPIPILSGPRLLKMIEIFEISKVNQSSPKNGYR